MKGEKRIAAVLIAGAFYLQDAVKGRRHRYLEPVRKKKCRDFANSGAGRCRRSEIIYAPEGFSEDRIGQEILIFQNVISQTN